MGLLDALSSDDAKLGIALLSASGYSPRPTSFGERLGGALQGYQAERTAAQDRALKTKLLQSQIDENASQNALRQSQITRASALADAPNQLFGWGGGGAAPSGVAGAAPANMGGGVQPGSLKGVPLASVTRYKMMGGPDLTKQWELENIGTAQQPGWVVRADGSREFLGDPSKGLTVGPDGVTRPMTGAPESLAAIARLQERAKAEEGARFQEGTPTINADGSKSVRSRLDMFGGNGAASGDPYINAIIKTESNGNPNAVSPKGAQGLMQVMPGTNTSPGFGVAPARDLSEGERTRVGQDYWKAMNERYQNPTLAAIAYNWGPGNTDMWLKSGGDFSKLPAETKGYVAAVMTRGAVNSRQPASNVVELSPQQQAQNKADEVKLVEGAKADVARDSKKQEDSKLQGRISGVAQQAMRLLDTNPTGSGAGALADSALNFIGQPTKAGNVAQSLEAVAGWMVANVPRMEGPQSNIDVLNYQTMAGRVGDRTLPAETRKAALREVIALQNKYAELNGGSKSEEPAPSGLPSGWSVKVK